MSTTKPLKGREAVKTGRQVRANLTLPRTEKFEALYKRAKETDERITYTDVLETAIDHSFERVFANKK